MKNFFNFFLIYNYSIFKLEMKFSPLNLHLHLSQTTTVNGYSTGWDIGYAAQKVYLFIQII